MFKWLKSIFVAEAPKAEAPKAEVEPKPKAAPKAKAEPKPKAAPKAKAEPKPKAALKAKAAPTQLDPWSSDALLKLTKAQLEEKGRQVGVELDRRKKKEDLVKQLLTAKK